VPKQAIPVSRSSKKRNEERSLLTVEKLKAGTRGKNAAQIAKELDDDISKLKCAHRVNADTLKKQISL
jgi:hypothetical protein